MSRTFLWLSIAMAVAALVGTTSTVVAQPLPTSTASTAPPPAKDYPEVGKAIELLNNRDLNGALKKLGDVAKDHPELPSKYVMMFRILAQNNQANLAKAMIERAIVDKDTAADPENWVILGSIALQENRLAESELAFLKAHQLLSGTYTSAQRKAPIEQAEMLGMASVAERRENWKVAEDRLKDYLKANPEDIVALQRLARSMFLQGNPGQSKPDDPPGAYEVLKRAKALDDANAKKNKTRPQMLPAGAYMAQYYDQSQHAKEQAQGLKFSPCESAKKWYEFALSEAKDDLNLRAVVLVWALDNGDAKLAREQAEKAMDIEKKHPDLYPGSIAGKMLAGYVALWEKKYAEAEEYFSKVILEAPQDFAAKNNMALTLVEEKEDEAKVRRAQEYAMASYKANQDNADALSTLSWVAYKTGDYRTAEMAINQVIKNTNGNLNPDTTTYLAHILEHAGQPATKYQAKQALEALLKSGRNFSMKREAEALYEKVKDAQPPAAAKTP